MRAQNGAEVARSPCSDLEFLLSLSWFFVQEGSYPSSVRLMEAGTNAREAIAKASPVLLLASCGEADEAWRSKLRSVRPSDLIDTLSEEVPADLWQSSFAWARKRAG
jgi:hypothetical protein